MKTTKLLAALSLIFMVIGCITGKDYPQAEYSLMELVSYESATRYTLEGRQFGMWQIWEDSDKIQWKVFVQNPSRVDSMLGRLHRVLKTK